MKEEPIPESQLKTTTNNKPREFRFASKEGLIIVSLILFAIYAFWYKIFEIYYSDNFIRWIIIFIAYSIVVFITMVILLITGIFVFWKDRRYIIAHEKTGAIIFLLGTLILLSVPIAWTNGLIEYNFYCIKYSW